MTAKNEQILEVGRWSLTWFTKDSLWLLNDSFMLGTISKKELAKMLEEYYQNHRDEFVVHSRHKKYLKWNEKRWGVKLTLNNKGELETC